MTPQNQKQIVSELSASVTGSVLDLIDAGKIPAEWDGIELRSLLADYFIRSTGRMDRKRQRAYDNTVLVNNL